MAVDSADNVYVFNRGNVPVLVFDSDGNVIDMWGSDSPWSGARSLIEDVQEPAADLAGEPLSPCTHSARTDGEVNYRLVDVLGHTITNRQDGKRTDAAGRWQCCGCRAASPSTARPTSRLTRRMAMSASRTVTATPGYTVSTRPVTHPLMGRAGIGPGAVQPPAQYLHVQGRRC